MGLPKGISNEILEMIFENTLETEQLYTNATTKKIQRRFNNNQIDDINQEEVNIR